jgi:acetyl-CoA carboxylase / biotin carboxylase 1
MAQINSEANGVTVPIVNGQVGSYTAKHDLPSHFIGGNRLEVAPPGSVKDFVAKNQGHSVITSVSLVFVLQQLDFEANPAF